MPERRATAPLRMLRLGPGAAACLAACVAMSLSGCAADRDAEEAVRVVEALEAALRAGDASRCRRLVTEQSAQALAELPWQQLSARQPLRVVGAEREDARYRVQVRDPNDGDRSAEFLVVREYGRLVVDLVETAGLTAEFVERELPQPEFVPRELTPADYERIRLKQLAEPPR